MSFRLSLLAASALVASNAAQAQLVTVPADVLANLDTRVTQNSGRIDTVSGQVATNTSAIATLDTKAQAAATLATAQGDAIATLQAKATAAANAATALDARVTATDAAVVDVNAKATANTAAIATVDAKADAATARLVTLDAQVLAANDAAVTLGGRTTDLEGKVGTLAAGATDTANRLVAVRNQIDSTATTVAELVPQVAKNTSDIADVDARATAGLSAVSARVTLNDQRDDAQDVTLNDHDRRIRVAQSTADTARVETATLRSDVDTGRVGIVRQAGPSDTVTVAAASGGTSVAFNGTDGDRRLTGVAAGVASNDAATVGQVNSSAAETLAAANGYTDRSIATALASNDARVERMLAGNNRALHADIDSSAAGSAALASLPQSIIPGSGMFGASIGGKGDQVAMALGLSKAFNAPHVPVLRAGAAIDTRTGEAVYNAAVGIHF